MSDKDRIPIVQTGREGLEQIRPLWKRLNRMHREKSRYFKGHFESYSFDRRRAEFENKSGVSVFIARDQDVPVGYCIAALDRGTGEIESIFILSKYRKSRLGGRLMERAEAWLIDKGAKRIRLCVAHGNESVFEFYNKQGYFQRFTVLEKKPNENKW